MDKIRYIIIFTLLFAWGACSSDVEQEVVPPQPEEASSIVSFSAAMNKEQGDGDESSSYFTDKDEIRICTPVSYSNPDFKDGAKIYTFKETKKEDYPYKFIAKEKNDEGTKQDENNAYGGFNWLTLEPTSIYYIFEAMYFPGNEYYDKVEADQRIEENFKKVDLLLAHHRMPISERGKPVKLTFHHAFAKVRVKITIPEHENPEDGVFPLNALKNVYMGEMLTSYTVNYAEVISNDKLRTTAGDMTKPREQVYMYRVEEPGVRQSSDKKHTYVYEGIVPAQKFRYEGEKFLFFEVAKHDGIHNGKEDDDEDGEENSNEKNKWVTYKFTPDDKGGFSLESSKILLVELTVKPEEQEVVVLKSEVLPWTEATTTILAGKENGTSSEN